MVKINKRHFIAKKILNLILITFLCSSITACGSNNKKALKGHKMGMILNGVEYSLPLQASLLLDRGYLFDHVEFQKEGGEEYLFNGTSKEADFLFKYEFSDNAPAIDVEQCTLTGITVNRQAHKTLVTTPEGFGMNVDFNELEKTYGKPDINVNGEIYVYLNEDKTYCYIFKQNSFYYGKITEQEIEYYQKMVKKNRNQSF